GGDFERAGERVGVQACDEADGEGFVGVDASRGREHLKGAGCADESGQSLSAAPACDDAEARAGVREDGLMGSNAEAAGEREVEAAAHAVEIGRASCRERV